MEKINKHKKPSSYIYKLFIYVALIALAISIIIPVAWVFMASLKKNSEFIGGDVSPWALPKEFFVQMINFFGGRVATLVVEEVILFVFITKLGFGSMVVKIAAQIIVIVLNYVISKLWVFRK